jgi:hypothetical protein
LYAFPDKVCMFCHDSEEECECFTRFYQKEDSKQIKGKVRKIAGNKVINADMLDFIEEELTPQEQEELLKLMQEIVKDTK